MSASLDISWSGSRPRCIDHGCDHVVVTDVPVGRDLPVLAVPGLDAPGARAFVVGARHLDRLEHVLKTELLEAVGADVEILETPAHLLASHRLLTELLLRGADRLDPEHSGDQPADVKDVPSLIPFWCHARALVVEVLLQVLVHLELTGRMLKGAAELYPLAPSSAGRTSGSAPDHHTPYIFSRG